MTITDKINRLNKSLDTYRNDSSAIYNDIKKLHDVTIPQATRVINETLKYKIKIHETKPFDIEAGPHKPLVIELDGGEAGPIFMVFGFTYHPLVKSDFCINYKDKFNRDVNSPYISTRIDTESLVNIIVDILLGSIPNVHVERNY